ncbi:transporter substrate-binding domain-containing protein [Plantactinospora alkalitolerans]|uniref:amino acid ABC transporter substrate-binding protein n=1 Tax=Plantactinospora alkalitolerans TaxID=2789879 RepID=UPI001E330BA2|nr:transporter substrate-binding domain-containing protein [Plantactinospora alkalitolerans]
MRRLAALLAVTGLLVGGCQWPRDTAGTLDDVRDGVLRVGITDNRPWTRVAGDGMVDGAEARLVERLAEQLGSRVEWHPGAESALMPALHDRVLDLVVGGLAADAPWTREASLTRPYFTTRTVVAAPADLAVPADLAGVRVAVPAGTAEVAALAAEKAIVVPVADATAAGGLPVVVGEWRIGELGLRRTSHELGSHDHVWAVPPGENGWQVEVERFLLALSSDEVERLLVAAETTGTTP